MQKIPTIFVRDESVDGHPVMDVVKDECQWVLVGEGVATRKLDGTNVKIASGTLFRRQKPKDRDYDAASYVPCDRGNPSDRWAFEAFDALNEKADGIYELTGPKVQGNPHRQSAHRMTRVVPVDPALVLWSDARPCSFEMLRNVLAAQPIEGIVFHHSDGRLAKIKRRDFRLPWPAPEAGKA